MKRKVIQLLALTFPLFAFILHTQATEYYISNAGNDHADGKSPKTSFKTLQRLNQVKLKPGDKVYFKSGNFFSGTLQIKHSGKKEKPIIFTSYGEGEKPVISGAVVVKNFHQVTENLYKASCKENIQYVFRNEKALTHARYPNKGFLKMDGGGHDNLIDYDFPLSQNDIVGANIRMRINNWQYEYRKVTELQNNKIKFDSILWNRPDWKNSCKKGWGYYLDGKQVFLDATNEWIYSKSGKELSLISDNAIESHDVIEGSHIEYGLILQKGVSYINLSGLIISGQTKNAVEALGNNSFINISNCEFSKIGKYALNFHTGCSYIHIYNNRINNVFGSGIKLFEANNCKVENNTIKNIGLVTGIGIDGVNGATGITIENEEKYHKYPSGLAHHNSVSYNYIDSIGYGCIRLDGHSSICEKNIVKNGMLTLNDGGLIYCWGYDTTYTYHNIFRGNIVMNSYGYTEGTPTDHKKNHGIYIDIRSKDLLVEKNTIVNCNTAILNNAQCFRNTFLHNMCYNNNKSISFSER